MVETKGMTWAVAGAITTGVAVLMLLLSLGVPSTREFPNTDVELAQLHGDQCERPRPHSAVVERANTWSNLAYLVAGLLVLLRARSAAGLLFGVNLAILAFASGFYHASLRELPQVLDVAWVYAALFSAILHGLYTLGRQTGTNVPAVVWYVLTGVFVVLGFLIKLVFHLDSTIVFIVLVAVLAVLVLSSLLASATQGRLGDQFGGPQVSTRNLTLELVGIAAIAGIGFVFRLGDGYADAGGAVTQKFLCSPDALIQAHALWHVLSAAALLLTYDLFAQLQQGSDGGATDRPAVYPAFER